MSDIRSLAAATLKSKWNHLLLLRLLLLGQSPVAGRRAPGGLHSSTGRLFYVWFQYMYKRTSCECT